MTQPTITAKIRPPGPIGLDSPPVGLHKGVDEATYRAWPAINQSLLKLGIPGEGSPLHIRAEIVAPKKPTKPMDEGTALHALVLQPERVNQLVYPLSEVREKRSRADKEWWDEQDRAANGRVILRSEVWDRVRRMADALLSHPISGAMLLHAEGMSEVAAVWDDSESRLRCKVRIDRLVPGVFAIDIKKTTEASESAFISTIKKYRYHCQAAWNEDGFLAATGERTDLTLAAVEDQYPFAVHCFCPSYKAVECGRLQLQASLRGYERSIRTNEWPSYRNNELTPFDLPPWEYARWGVGQ